MDGLVLDRAAPGVFRLDDQDTWRRWRARKLDLRPANAGALVVEVGDPRALTRAERAAIVGRCAAANMAIYATALSSDDPAIPLRIAAQLGLHAPEPSPAIEPDATARMPWHTEGHRHPIGLPVRSAVLHCVRAADGGELALLDPELAWLLLRDAGDDFVRALMREDAFSVPGRLERHAVFAVDAATGDLRMRFTERREAIEWKRDATVSEAAARLRRLLDRDTSCVVRVRLEAGMGLVCNNVLRTRAMVVERPGVPHETVRACFRERITGTERAWRALVG